MRITQLVVLELQKLRLPLELVFLQQLQERLQLELLLRHSCCKQELERHKQAQEHSKLEQEQHKLALARSILVQERSKLAQEHNRLELACNDAYGLCIFWLRHQMMSGKQQPAKRLQNKWNAT